MIWCNKAAFGMQDIEFTVQEQRLWMLQCRTGKRTGRGAVKIAVDMVNEGLVDTREAVMKVEPQHLDQLLHPQVHTSFIVLLTAVPLCEFVFSCSLRIHRATRTV